jgi:LacI family transcriptional regulator
VLLVVSPIWEESANKILHGISSFQRQHEPWDTIWDNEGLSLTDTGWFDRQAWDGVISRHTNAIQVYCCQRLGVPLVDVNNSQPIAGVPNIAGNNRAIGQLGAEHFIDRGFTHFAFCGFGNEGWSVARSEGFREALTAVNRTCLANETEYPGYYSHDINPGWHAAEIDRLAKWLTELPKPVGVMACNDFRALDLLQAAGVAGLKVPEEVAILGANNDEVRCELAHPPLSSVAANHFQSGYKAAEALHHLMNGQSLDGLDLVSDPVDVIARQSTDILAVEDPRIATAVRYIHQNACRGLTVDEVGRHAGIARTQLEEKFRRFFSRSPQAEIRRIQLNKIKQLLADTELPLRQIAELTGFTHTEYMMVFFKREVGEAPGRYRRRLHCRRSTPHSARWKTTRTTSPAAPSRLASPSPDAASSAVRR